MGDHIVRRAASRTPARQHERIPTTEICPEQLDGLREHAALPDELEPQLELAAAAPEDVGAAAGDDADDGAGMSSRTPVPRLAHTLRRGQRTDAALATAAEPDEPATRSEMSTIAMPRAARPTGPAIPRLYADADEESAATVVAAPAAQLVALLMPERKRKTPHIAPRGAAGSTGPEAAPRIAAPAARAAARSTALQAASLAASQAASQAASHAASLAASRTASLVETDATPRITPPAAPAAPRTRTRAPAQSAPRTPTRAAPQAAPRMSPRIAPRRPWPEPPQITPQATPQAAPAAVLDFETPAPIVASSDRPAGSKRPDGHASAAFYPAGVPAAALGPAPGATVDAVPEAVTDAAPEAVIAAPHALAMPDLVPEAVPTFEPFITREPDEDALDAFESRGAIERAIEASPRAPIGAPPATGDAGFAAAGAAPLRPLFIHPAWRAILYSAVHSHFMLPIALLLVLAVAAWLLRAIL